MVSTQKQKTSDIASTTSQAKPADEASDPVFHIQRVYLKDLSLEQPNSPAIFLENEIPQVDISLDVGAEVLAEGVIESTVTVTITAKIKDKVAFLVEGKQAGIFEVRNIPDDQLDPLLGINCPGIVYPYLRANIADAITRGGFPPIHITEVNFEIFYRQRLEALAKQQTKQDNENSKTTTLPKDVSTGSEENAAGTETVH